MMEGRGNTCFTVFISPRPFRIRLAFPSIIRVMARRVLQTLIGSKFALSTNTGACMAASNAGNYSTVVIRWHSYVQPSKNRLFRPGLSHPFGGNPRLLTEVHIQLCTVFLDVAHIIYQQLGKADALS